MINRCCPNCQTTKPVDNDFGFTKDGKPKSWCRVCTRKATEDWRQRRTKSDPEYAKQRLVKGRKARENKDRRIVFMYHSLAHSAKRHGRTFTVEKHHLSTMLQAQDWKCARTGIPFDLSTGRGKRPFGPAVDRVDTLRGYEPDNIQIVCNVYNFAKNAFSDDAVLQFANALVAHSIRSLQERVKRRAAA